MKIARTVLWGGAGSVISWGYPTSATLYTGEQLDMADNDVFLHALLLAQGRKAGEQIHFVRSHFLQAIGRSPGTTSYKWLKDSLQRIASASLFIENSDGDGKMFRLIS